ncbi:NADPH-dependent FMN reductase [Sphingobacterium sp. 1.A.4]|uniref:NADPH-dependent FMN reductase n=1 Tax=Sphingobacterium sp. 1.A.4 TaxID=2044603 RepID=UPI000C0BF4C6|nr:NAD(P)H-dependent oxidoreductase [Sphingobacterium sp. 1.A.4]
MKILAFAGSNSRHSINKKLVTSVSKYYKDSDDQIEILDLNDYEMPIFSVDREKEDGIPELAHEFAAKIDAADLLLISLSENNSSYSAAYKNIMDWVSRIKGRKVFGDKPVFLMGTSDGARGARSVLEAAENRMPRDGAELLDIFSLPTFYENFEEGKGVTDLALRSKLEAMVRKTKRTMKDKLAAKKD